MAVLPPVILLQHEADVGHLRQVVFVAPATPVETTGKKHLRWRLLKSFATEVVATLKHGLPPLIGVQEELQSPIGLACWACWACWDSLQEIMLVNIRKLLDIHIGHVSRRVRTEIFDMERLTLNQ